MKTTRYIKILFINFALICSNPVLAQTVLEQQPMYGQVNNSERSNIIEQNEKLLSDAVRTFGTREHASEGYTEKGFDHYSNGEFNKSMNRFNQAWLLNPENPYPYLGFGLLMNVDKQYCEAYKMFKLSNEKGLNENGFLADFAYTTSQCAVTKGLEEKEKLFKFSNELHEQAIQTPNKRLLAYVYHSWAKSFFLQKNINKTNEMIQASREFGGKIDVSFLNEVKNYSK